MRKNMKRMALGAALLLLAACTQDDNAPDVAPGGKIALTPAVELAAGWNTGTSTRADQTAPVSLVPGGGSIVIMIGLVGADGYPSPDNLQANYFEMTADGKLRRLPFSGKPEETEEPLNVAAPGEYYVAGGGENVNLMTDGITYRSYIASQGVKVTIGTDGKVVAPMEILAGGLRLNVRGTDGNAYAGADVTATLKNVHSEVSTAGSLETKTLTAAAPSVIWGDIDSRASVSAGTQLLELIVDGKTYKVNAPRQISFTAGRLYTFNVRVGATSITVSSSDLSIGDFVVQASTAAEADAVPFYNGKMPNLLAVPGQTPYWVAPENAATDVKWTDIDFATVCPAGWHVPTKDEFIAMTGLVPDSPQQGALYDAVIAAFETGGFTWSSTAASDSQAWQIYMGGNIGLGPYEQSGSGRVRCVRKK